jgi:hypothetical protein
MYPNARVFLTGRLIDFPIQEKFFLLIQNKLPGEYFAAKSSDASSILLVILLAVVGSCEFSSLIGAAPSELMEKDSISCK